MSATWSRAAPAALVAVVLAVSLACDGDFLFDYPGIDDGTPQDAADLGYVVPAGAEHVYVATTSGLDVSGAWIRYDLDATELDAYRTTLQDDPTFVLYASDGTLPEHADVAGMTSCPDCPPSWWSPGPEVWFAERPLPNPSGSGGRNIITLHPETGQVHRYTFLVQFWEPAEG